MFESMLLVHLISLVIRSHDVALCDIVLINRRQILLPTTNLHIIIYANNNMPTPFPNKLLLTANTLKQALLILVCIVMLSNVCLMFLFLLFASGWNV